MFRFGLMAGVCAGLFLAIALSGTVDAASLSGQVGDKRRGQVLPNRVKGSCGAAWQAYVAASGHSAYASTRYIGPFVRNNSEAIFCGTDRNAPSQAKAEQRAVANCNAAKKKYRLGSSGPCEVVASK